MISVAFKDVLHLLIIRVDSFTFPMASKTFVNASSIAILSYPFSLSLENTTRNHGLFDWKTKQKTNHCDI
jgi:hypothetical protein